MTEIVLATRNKNKLDEISYILKEIKLTIRTLDEFPAIPELEENYNSIKENALHKAKTVYEYTGLPTLADDTGLEVDFLSGRPGVLSARFASEKATYEDNNRKLLKMLEGVPDIYRKARFHCVAVFKDDKIEKIAEGICEGKIAFKPEGRHGFGYDPLFIVNGLGKTFAELTAEEKNSISHRAIAFNIIAVEIKSHFNI
ncbi:MAG: RdgB/HAM1 family non-canonical purine NTP pyrophosphatase [Fidelibacterota bacterium]